jgi:hypothetical protein
VKTATSALVDEGAEEAMACAARGELVLVLVLVRLRVARSAYLCSGGGERWSGLIVAAGGRSAARPLPDMGNLVYKFTVHLPRSPSLVPAGGDDSAAVTAVPHGQWAAGAPARPHRVVRCGRARE